MMLKTLLAETGTECCTPICASITNKANRGGHLLTSKCGSCGLTVRAGAGLIGILTMR